MSLPALPKKSWCWGYQHDTCIDSTRGGNEARFINHSENGNAYTEKVFFQGNWHLIYLASKSIKKGDQFLINYGRGYWAKNSHKKVNL